MFTREPEAATGATESSRRWAMLALLALGQLFGMSLWFTASAVSPHFAGIWGLDAQQVGWLTTSVQLGFVAGTAVAALLNTADVLPARALFAGAAVCAAAANLGLLIAPGFEVGVILRFMTGFMLAGVYPPAMKMTATWFRRGRGLAIGVIVGALTAGKATPHLIGVVGAGAGSVIVTASAAAVLAAVLVGLLYRDGPHAFERRPFQWSLVATVMRHRETRLAIGGYCGHMWELYAMWSIISMFFYDYFTRDGGAHITALNATGMSAFAVIAVGAAGCVIAGRWADAWGREQVTIYAMAISGSCALLMGHLLDAPPWVVAVVALLWGSSIVADSAQFSALVTEVTPPHAVGTALTLQTSIGFLLTALSIPTTLAIANTLGWAVAFSLLALGPALGIVAMWRLKQVRG